MLILKVAMSLVGSFMKLISTRLNIIIHFSILQLVYQDVKIY